MRVYTKVVIDIATMETIEEESFEYDGEVALCGSSGGGGGGGSGEVDYPSYMKNAHAQLLYGAGESSSGDMDIVTPVDDAINDAISGNPFIDLAPYNPSPHVVEMANAIDDFDVFVNSMESTNEVENNLAKFDAGMRDINAVNSSAFVIGRQIIASTIMVQKLQAKQELARMSIEARRIMIVANREFIDQDNEYQVKFAKWDLEMLQHGANVLAGISGASTVSSGSEPSKAQSAIGGAMSGAAAGAMMGSSVPGIGTAAGAVAGGVLGAAGGLL